MKDFGKIIMAVGHPHHFHRAAPWVAMAKGYFKEEGIPASEVISTGEDEYTLDGIIKGSIHFGLDVRPAIMLQASNKGQDVFILGAMINGFAFNLIAAKGINTPQDLKGKRIEVVGHGGGIDERQIRAYLRKNGMDPEKDVIWVRDAPFPNIRSVISRIEAGEIDARAVWTEDAPIANERGQATLCDFFADLYPEGYLQRAIVASGKMIKENPDTIMAFLKGLLRAYRFLNREENYLEINKIIEDSAEPGLGWEDMDYSKVEKHYLGFKILPPDGHITKVGFQQMIDEEKMEGRLPQSFAMAQVVRLSFIEKAAKELDDKYGPLGYK